MFFAVTKDDKVISGQELEWSGIPADVVIKSLQCKLQDTSGRVIANFEVEGFDEYGFQRYDLVAQQGLIGRGIQLLARRGEVVVVHDVDIHSGTTRISSISQDACSYRKDLWRSGC